MTEELKVIFKGIGLQAEWLTMMINSVDKRSRRTKFMLFSAIAAGIGYVVKNEKDKQKLEQELTKLKCKSDTIEESSIF